VHRTVEYVLGLVRKARGQVLGLVRIVGKRANFQNRQANKKVILVSKNNLLHLGYLKHFASMLKIKLLKKSAEGRGRGKSIVSFLYPVPTPLI